ncbi:MAG: hypothetical protein AAF771_16815 [Pseudomonadota bacterium]
MAHVAGHYDSLIRRIGRVYAERRSVIEEALARHGLGVQGRGEFGGSSIWMRAPEHVDTTHLAAELQGKGVLIEPGAPFFGLQNPPLHFYRLAYSSISSEDIPAGVALLAQALSDYSGK